MFNFCYQNIKRLNKDSFSHFYRINGTVVVAGSIVTRSLPAYCIAAGQPAKVIVFLKDRYPDIENPANHHNVQSSYEDEK